MPTLQIDDRQFGKAINSVRWLSIRSIVMPIWDEKVA